MPEQGERRHEPPNVGLGERLRRIALGTAELILACLMVFVFFLTFLGIISFSFPQGTTLRNLMVQTRWEPRPTTPRTTIVPLRGETKNQPLGAKLASTRRVVKAKDAQGIAWGAAQQGMKLKERDSLQTFDRSAARIKLRDDNQVELGENSLIVIRRPDDRRAKVEVRSTLRFTGLLDAGKDETENEEPPLAGVEIATANGSSAVLPDGVNGSRLIVTSGRDATSTFALHEGSARIRSGGRTIVLLANQAITVDGIHPPGTPVALPAPPAIRTPADGSTLTYRSAPPLVQLEWEPVAASDAYRVQIGRDADFDDVIYDGEVPAEGFAHGNLEPGTYYWKVAALSGGLMGRPSKPRRLVLNQDDEPPRLTVELPTRVGEALLRIRGTTEPGAEVFVDDRSVVADGDGVFEHALNLERGVNLVTVEAVDAAGNIAYRSELIHANY